MAARNRVIIHSVINIIFAVLFGAILFRLCLGMRVPDAAVYLKTVGFILQPVFLLRNLSDDLIFIILYLTLWIYALLRQSVAENRPVGLIFYLRTIPWAAAAAVPFFIFGIQYFSLLRFNSAINSQVLRIIPFLSLFILFFLLARFHFRQRFTSALIWTINSVTAAIFLITLADLLPMIKTQPFFDVLHYRISLINDFMYRFPVSAFLLFIGVGFFLCFIIKRYFILSGKNAGSLKNLFFSASLFLLLFSFLFILMNDYQRYEKFDYSAGINTIYLTKYQNRQSIWFDNRAIRFRSGDFKMSYPFGDFELPDTLRAHAGQIAEMGLIEGLSYYKLRRILKIARYGPRDSTLFNLLGDLIDEEKYVIPSFLKKTLAGIKTRYTENADIDLNGWIEFNDRPFEDIDVCFSRHIEAERVYSEPVWKGKTDNNGKFSFNCYNGVKQKNSYFLVSFMFPDTFIGYAIEYLKVCNPFHHFSDAGSYILDTARIEVKKRKGSRNFITANIYPDAPLDSFELWFPAIEQTTGAGITAHIIQGGKIVVDRISLVGSAGQVDTEELKHRILKKTKKWRFFGTPDRCPIEIYLNADKGW